MKMIFRWFPNGDDSVSLWQIKQIPGVRGVATMFPDIPVGEVWPMEQLSALKQEVNDAGLEVEVIESVNIHEDIKKGLPTREKYIENYIKTIENLSRIGVKCLCYNFMPVMDWARSDLAQILADQSTALAYDHEKVLAMNPFIIAEQMIGNANGYSLPGWERERLKVMAKDIDYYQGMTIEEYRKNVKYFLDAVIPYAEKNDIKMAIHPDDPPFQIFGLPRLINSRESIRCFFDLNKSKYNGLTLCTGSLGADTNNDVCAIAEEFAAEGRIHFAHIRNIKHTNPKVFTESAHVSECGDLDLFKIVEALYRNGFDGYIRPDHGRMIWNEKARPGYGLYDRALGANYILGLWEAIDKLSRQ